MNEPRRVAAVEMQDADQPGPGLFTAAGLFAASWRWLRRDFILRRLSLMASALCLVFVFGYLLLHVITLVPLLLLAVLAFLYGVSGRRPDGP